MVSQKVVIKNPTGLHLRPAGILCKEAMQFKSLITFTFKETGSVQNYNQGKSFYGVLGLVEAYNKYSLTLNIKNIDGNPLANKDVTLHSTPMSGTTNENGTVVFNNVELGNHTLSVIDNDITITTNIGITGGKNDVVKIDDRYKIKPKNENTFFPI